MRDFRLPAILAGVLAIHALGTSPAVTATELQQGMWVPGAVCQLSIPTTNTGVRPKATGFRNESTTTSNFVICPVVLPTMWSSQANPVTLGAIYLGSLDGMAHSVSCTAVVGLAQLGFAPSYSTKNIAVAASTNAASVASWGASDFGQPSNILIDGSAWFTVTCTLPPQVQILSLQAYSNTHIAA
jgi:hypothetical protein